MGAGVGADDCLGVGDDVGDGDGEGVGSEVVGVAVGEGVGSDDTGDVLGAVVGGGVGPAVVGAAVGGGVGSAVVGPGDGDEVGADVVGAGDDGSDVKGAGVGRGVGSEVVGAVVGAVIGGEVGAMVGCRVGPGVGLGVGCTDGDGVGADDPGPAVGVAVCRRLQHVAAQFRETVACSQEAALSVAQMAGLHWSVARPQGWTCASVSSTIVPKTRTSWTGMVILLFWGRAGCLRVAGCRDPTVPKNGTCRGRQKAGSGPDGIANRTGIRGSPETGVVRLTPPAEKAAVGTG